MAGLSLAQALKSPIALGGPWRVYGTARRPKPNSFPTAIMDHYTAFDATSRDDTPRHFSVIDGEVTHVFWVAMQLHDSEEDNVMINATMLQNVLNFLKLDPGWRLIHITLQTGTKHYMGPIFNPTHSAQLVPYDPSFSEDSTQLPYPNFYNALEDLVASYAPAITYSVHGASIIFDASSRSLHNTLLTVAAYAAICRDEGLRFRFPGTRYTWEHFCDASDARVLAEQHIWAAVIDRANNQAFNCSNGDFFTWKSMWKVFSQVF